jgi:REP element-mobilizing transposase RayT
VSQLANTLSGKGVLSAKETRPYVPMPYQAMGFIHTKDPPQCAMGKEFVMKFDPKKHHRRSIRLPGYDYSQAGAYYVTIVAQGRECLFGEVVNAEMRLSRYGQIVQYAWFDLPKHYPHVELDAFCIMPNHAHGIIVLHEDGRGGSFSSMGAWQSQSVSGQASSDVNRETHPYVRKRHPLSEIVRAFKSFSARRINVLRKTPGIPVWQRNYYEHVIRNEKDYQAKRNYILSNPENWENDDENQKP